MSAQYTKTLVKQTKDYITTIKIWKSQKDRLSKQGFYGEPMTDIIERLLQLAEKKGGARK